MINLQGHVRALDDRIDAITRLLDATHPAVGAASSASTPSISRETRGVVIVLLFASYEHLLTSLTRTLLEATIRVGVGNKRLQPGLRALAFANAAKSIRAVSEKKLYSTTLPKLVKVADPGGRLCTIDPNSFPSDGSFMKRTQIVVWCNIFGVPDPRSILHRRWDEIDGVVSARNAVAHGSQTPDEVGRNYSEGEIRDLVKDWHDDWTDFLQVVVTLASTRSFFRLP